MRISEGRKRVVIEELSPAVECGLYPIKRSVGDRVEVKVTIYADGHNEIAACLLYCHEKSKTWQEVPLRPIGNDMWQAEFSVNTMGRYRYTVRAWIDHFASWNRDLKKWVEARQDISVALKGGCILLEEIAERAKKADAKRLKAFSGKLLQQSELHPTDPFTVDHKIVEIVQRYPNLHFASTYHKELELIVDRDRAQFSTWYELFPRSCAQIPGEHGTFRDCERLIPSIAAMGFDVLYLPPIHPIGSAFRKGKNNNVVAVPEDVGSPWAIGSEDGGHKSIHKQLGTLDDFRHLVSTAKEQGMEIALDIAFQCSPDHPYVREHPEWFIKRADGSIQYAENPPKKYQDIYPLNFETAAWRELWNELKSVFVYWIKEDVRIFRVDNPHTKAFPFWEWMIAEVKKTYPGVIFLAEAFTRPHVMYGLAKRGFSQSYTYFTWRNSKDEIRKYFEELTQSPVREFFRANLWPNTPDILHETLQMGGRTAFIMRYILAATLGANCGIYGPAFELCESAPVKHGSEEYYNSEKYQLRAWNRDAEHSIAPLIARVNAIRRAHPALQRDHHLRFHDTDNPMLLCYSKVLTNAFDIILVVVNLDPHFAQAGWTALDLQVLGIRDDETYTVHDLLADNEYQWTGARNYIALDPQVMPAHIFHVKKHLA
ncbi:MAG: alpha-1,4-glucan--maltose-1-phosphate maltosyltransferase [Acidobacteriaceae bacterium]